VSNTRGVGGGGDKTGIGSYRFVTSKEVSNLGVLCGVVVVEFGCFQINAM